MRTSDFKSENLGSIPSLGAFLLFPIPHQQCEFINTKFIFITPKALCFSVSLLVGPIILLVANWSELGKNYGVTGS